MRARKGDNEEMEIFPEEDGEEDEDEDDFVVLDVTVTLWKLQGIRAEPRSETKRNKLHAENEDVMSILHARSRDDVDAGNHHEFGSGNGSRCGQDGRQKSSVFAVVSCPQHDTARARTPTADTHGVNNTISKSKSKSKGITIPPRNKKKQAHGNVNTRTHFIASRPLGYPTSFIGDTLKYAAKWTTKVNNQRSDPSCASQQQDPLAPPTFRLKQRIPKKRQRMEDDSNNSNEITVDFDIGLVHKTEMIDIGTARLRLVVEVDGDEGGYRLNHTKMEILVVSGISSSLHNNNNSNSNKESSNKKFWSKLRGNATGGGGGKDPSAFLYVYEKGRNMRTVTRSRTRDYFVASPARKYRVDAHGETTLHLTVRVSDANEPPWDIIHEYNVVVPPLPPPAPKEKEVEDDEYIFEDVDCIFCGFE